MLLDAVPPQSLEAELCLIGCVLVDSNCLPEISSRLVPSDFHDMRCEAVFGAMLNLEDQNVRIDKISLVTYLRERNMLDRVGGIGFFNEAIEVIPTIASVNYYVEIISKKSQMRKMIVAGATITRLGYEMEHDPEKAYSEAMDALSACDASNDNGEHLAPEERLRRAYERAVFPQKRVCVKSPWQGLNEKIGGFYPGQLIVWAGAPKTGKSGAALTMADSIARHQGTVVYFAIEMDEEEMTERQLALHSGVSVVRQRSGELNPKEQVLLAEAFEKSMKTPLQIVRHKIRTVSAMRRTCRKFERNGPIQAIVVDHVGKMSEVLSGSSKENKVERLDRTYNLLIDLAREFKCAVHVIQHINREGFKQGRPTMADIRDGGNPEGHANAVLILYREDTMNVDGNAHKAEIIIAASRNGEAGIVPMKYDGIRGLWTDSYAF